MGAAARLKPARLAEKLLRIRTSLGLSQNGMITRLAMTEELVREDISKFELGKREPSLLVILQYARIANVWVEVIIDDTLDLPDELPSPKKSKGLEYKLSLS
jgi:transcriptional regulator with XRE-family HTH domain